VFCFLLLWAEDDADDDDVSNKWFLFICVVWKSIAYIYLMAGREDREKKAVFVYGGVEWYWVVSLVSGSCVVFKVFNFPSKHSSIHLLLLCHLLTHSCQLLPSKQQHQLAPNIGKNLTFRSGDKNKLKQISSRKLTCRSKLPCCCVKKTWVGLEKTKASSFKTTASCARCTRKKEFWVLSFEGMKLPLCPGTCLVGQYFVAWWLERRVGWVRASAGSCYFVKWNGLTLAFLQ